MPDEMWSMPLDVISFSSAISACGKGEQWQHAAPPCDERRRRGVLFDAICFYAAKGASKQGSGSARH
eukprot:6101401-Karenia_brevis.AAC.1